MISLILTDMDIETAYFSNPKEIENAIVACISMHFFILTNERNEFIGKSWGRFTPLLFAIFRVSNLRTCYYYHIHFICRKE